VSARAETILRHWREAVPDDRLAHLVKDATRALVRALQMRLAEHKVSFGHWTFLRVPWEGDGLTQRELSDEAGVTEPTTFSALKAMERLGARGLSAAVAALFGLALMVGASAGTVALAGIGFGLAAAGSRVVTLLLTRAQLAGADSRLISWFSILSATAVFAVIALATWNWQPCGTPRGFRNTSGWTCAPTRHSCSRSGS